MAVEKTPNTWTNLDSHGVEKVYNHFQNNFLGYYFKDGELNDVIKSISGFNPNDYDLRCARMDGYNSSFLLTPFGYAINITIFKRNRDMNILPELGKDGVVYVPNERTGRISIDDMSKSKHLRKAESYKVLCDRYLKSSTQILKDEIPQNSVNIFW